MNNSLFTSNSEEWETPQMLFNELNRKFDFQLDVCATAHNAKCAEYYTKETDGLSHPWKMRNWMNPPYGREIVKWVERANAESIKGGGAYRCASPSANRYAVVRCVLLPLAQELYPWQIAVYSAGWKNRLRAVSVYDRLLWH